jgi:hypothetical protein
MFILLLIDLQLLHLLFPTCYLGFIVSISYITIENKLIKFKCIILMPLMGNAVPSCSRSYYKNSKNSSWLNLNVTNVILGMTTSWCT